MVGYFLYFVCKTKIWENTVREGGDRALYFRGLVRALSDVMGY